MDNNDNETNPATNWWSTTPDGWADVSEATFDGWQPDQWAPQALGAMTALEAMAFGFGSRAAYGSESAWEDVQERVKADWRESGGERAHEWEHVLDAVKTGWIAGGVAPQPAALPDANPAPVAYVDAPTEPIEHHVPGGRPDRHAG